MSFSSSLGKGIELLFSNIRSIIALFIVLFAFTFLFTLLHYAVPPANKDIINTVTGLVIATISGVTGFYFGSSKNESDSKKVIADPHP